MGLLRPILVSHVNNACDFCSILCDAYLSPAAAWRPWFPSQGVLLRIYPLGVIQDTCFALEQCKYSIESNPFLLSTFGALRFWTARVRTLHLQEFFTAVTVAYIKDCFCHLLSLARMPSFATPLHPVLGTVTASYPRGPESSWTQPYKIRRAQLSSFLIRNR